MKQPRAGVKRHPLASELWAKLREGKGIYEARLHDEDYHLDGLCEGGKVYVDPAPSVVESLVHELVHKIRPKYGERRVLAESRRLVSLMTPADLRRWYRTYQRVAVKRQTPKRFDE